MRGRHRTWKAEGVKDTCNACGTFRLATSNNVGGLETDRRSGQLSPMELLVQMPWTTMLRVSFIERAKEGVRGRHGWGNRTEWRSTEKGGGGARGMGGCQASVCETQLVKQRLEEPEPEKRRGSSKVD